MNRIKYIYDIIEYLTAHTEPKKLKEITNRISDLYGEPIPERRIKQYLVDIQDNFNILENVQGRHGGYKLAQEAKDSLIKTILRGLDEKDRNAINDAFEVAERSPAYHYTNELIKAKGYFYRQLDLKDDDHEYYLGKTKRSKVDEFIYELKDAMKDNYKVEISSKYDYFQIKKGTHVFAPLFIFHDSNETFIALRDSKSNIVYQNINNIVMFKVLAEKFVRFGLQETNWQTHISKNVLKVQDEIIIELTKIKERAATFIELWNHDFEIINETKSKKKIMFHEKYKAAQFLFIVSEYVDYKVENKEFLEYFKGKISAISK